MKWIARKANPLLRRPSVSGKHGEGTGKSEKKVVDPKKDGTLNLRLLQKE